MHSFQPSRGRVLFEVFCALAVVASMVGAWRQTGASALLTAAVAAALYAMVRLFDLARRGPAQAEEPQRIEFEPEAQVDVRASMAVELPPAELEPAPVVQLVSEEPEVAEPVAARKDAGRRKGGSRKGSGRRAGAAKETKVVELAPVEEADVDEPAPAEEVQMAEPAPFEEAEIVAPETVEDPEAVEFAPPEPLPESVHVPHAPLFEPEPFVRMPRQAFGRRGRI